MYDELYASWRLEIENGELGSLPPDFYARLAEYLRRIKEENRMTDAKSVKVTLLQHEMANAALMAQELILVRYRKLVKLFVAGQKVRSDSLTSEEQKLCNGVLPSTESYNKFAAGILEGQLVRINVETVTQAAEPQVVHARVTLRFLKPVPSIIGSDMKSYGPFLVEDVASVPSENAKILIKQGLAKAVEVG
jgi:DNA replication initiation complex subunit (GINS family)